MSIQLAPEIEDGLRAEAAARGVSVDRVMREALDLYRSHQHDRLPPVAHRGHQADRLRETAWVTNPDLQYCGEWVALEGDEVVAHGTDGKVVYESARSQGIASPFLFFVSEPEDPRPFAGGWLGAD